MKKEVLLAIVVGFVLGLVITFGIWTANKSLKRANISKITSVLPTPTPSQVTPSPSPAPVVSELVITSPEDESLLSTNTVKVTGKTAPNSVIGIAFENDQTLTQADTNGNFTSEVDLIGGYNTIVVTSTDPANGSESSQTLFITYSTAKL